MRAALVLPVLLAVGCSKKGTVFTGRGDAAGAPQPAQVVKVADKAKPAEKAKAEEKPNWLTDPAKKDTGQLPVDAPDKKSGFGPPAVVTPVPADDKPPRVEPQPPARPQPANPTAVPAAGKAVTERDMKDVWIFIENASGATGQMPSPELVLAVLEKERSPAAELVKDTSIWLTGVRRRDGVWAYETRAVKHGGWVASQNGVEMMTAAELAARLKQ